MSAVVRPIAGVVCRAVDTHGRLNRLFQLQIFTPTYSK